MKKPYLTIKENGEATIEIKKSEFICSLARTETEEEARAFIDKIKTEHRKATHNCFAYMIGLNDEIQRESDNGEPSGTAGVPILEGLKKLDLHNATSNAIEHVGVVRKVVQTELSLKVSYSAWGKLQNYLENNQVNVSDTVFMTDVTAVVYVDTPEVESFTATIVDLMNGQVEVEEGQEKYVEVPYELYK